VTLSLELWLYLLVATSFIVFLCWLALSSDLLDAIPPSDRPRVLRRLRLFAWLGVVHPLFGLAAWDAGRTYAARSDLSPRSASLLRTMRVAACTSAVSTAVVCAAGLSALP
jgi:hypothetical protein